jgi:transcriptional regulator with XRE-family HTH domain
MATLHPATPPDRLAALAVQGDALRAARAQAGLDQRETAKRLGMSIWTYRSYEQGIRGVPAGRHAAIRELLGVDPATLTVGGRTVCPTCHRPYLED